jgi:hypothetical protein
MGGKIEEKVMTKNLLSTLARLAFPVCDAAFGIQKVRVIEWTSHVNKKNKRRLASAID